jgi:hypothetical protein
MSQKEDIPALRGTVIFTCRNLKSILAKTDIRIILNLSTLINEVAVG